MKLTRMVTAMVLLALLISVSKASHDSGGEYYKYLPLEKQKQEYLALTSQGDFVKMTYTPATYRLQKNVHYQDFFELQIWDALLHLSDGSEDVNTTYSMAQMKLVFLSEDGKNDWSVSCYDPLSKKDIKLADPEKNELIISENSCGFRKNDWSDSIKIFFGSSESLLLKTVWQDSTQKYYSGTQYKDLINVFRFRSKRGRVTIAETKEGNISQYEGQKNFNFRVLEEKESYVPSLNWIVLFNTAPLVSYEFALDVSDVEYFLLFDKDADAAKLHGPSTPNDTGVSLKMQWKDDDNTPLTVNPEWTNLDQTSRSGFRPPEYVEGETNSYEGPSGDTGKDQKGITSIQWYKIHLPKERKSDFIKLSWSNFSARYNGFAFASSKELYSDFNKTDIDIPYSYREKKNRKTPPEEKKPPKDQEEDNDQGLCPKNCVTKGSLKVQFTSKPKPHPSEESFGLDPKNPSKNSIEYQLTVTNISTVEKPVTIKKLNLGLDPPEFTTVVNSQWGEIIATPSYQGKGPGRIDLASELKQGEKIFKSLTVILDQLGKTDYDISTKDRLELAAENHDRITLPTLVHHVGKGAVSIDVKRCFAYDYYGGDFQCDSSCKPLEPGTKITVRDTLNNTGGSDVNDYLYFPPALSSTLKYLENSIRIDHPLTGSREPNDGANFPPQAGIKIPGTIVASSARAVFFSYMVGEGDDQCLLQTPEFETPPSENAPNNFHYEFQCPGTKDGQQSPYQICVIVPKKPLLEAVLTANPSPKTKLYQQSVVEYRLTLKNMTKKPVTTLVIDGVVPSQTTCQGLDCQGKNLKNPPELIDSLNIYEYRYIVKVNEGASGSNISHKGHQISFSGDQDSPLETVSSNTLTHSLVATPQPTGVLQHDITLNRRIVLNSKDSSLARPDEGDKAIITHSFDYPGRSSITGKFLFPFIGPSSQVQENGYPEGNNCYRYWATYRPWSYSSYFDDTPVIQYEAWDNSEFILYKDTASPQDVYPRFSHIPQSGAVMVITTNFLSDRPKIINISGRGSSEADQIALPYSLTNLGKFVHFGGKVEQEQLRVQGEAITAIPKTPIRAVADGTIDGDTGNIRSRNLVNVVEEIWRYEIYPQGNFWGRGIRCTYDYRGWTYYAYNVPTPLRQWHRVSVQSLTLEGIDQDYLTALSSVAWLKTRQGHFSIGKPFWKTQPVQGQPNFVELADASLPIAMKLYTPLDEHHSDMYVFANDSEGILSSRLGGQALLSPLNNFSEGKLSRGEIYDRNSSARNFEDDLLKSELYSSVVRLNTAPLPKGLTKIGSLFQAQGTLELTPETVYFLEGNLELGASADNELVISGERARIVVKGTVFIKSNIRSSSVRIQSSSHIFVQPEVMLIELMLLTENEFHSGKSQQQLKILGDIIAKKAFFERRPLNEKRATEETINKPSELIIEDYRKYLLTPPGDKKLYEIGPLEREVFLETGLPKMEILLRD